MPATCCLTCAVARMQSGSMMPTIPGLHPGYGAKALPTQLIQPVVQKLPIRALLRQRQGLAVGSDCLLAPAKPTQQVGLRRMGQVVTLQFARSQ